MENKLKIFAGIAMLLLSVSFASAITQEQHDSMNLISRFSYDLAHGAYLFTSWGQTNGCSVTPDPVGMGRWISKGSTAKCTDICSYDKCALDIWYDNTIYLNNPQHPSSVNWNNWLKEVSGTGVSFSGNSYPFYYVETYCCPQTVPPVTTPSHTTNVYQCVNGNWNKIRTASSGSEGYCTSTSNNYYLNTPTTGGCYNSAPSGWCVAPQPTTCWKVSGSTCISFQTTSCLTEGYASQAVCLASIPCPPDNSCAANICSVDSSGTAQYCTNNCGTPIQGTKNCGTEPVQTTNHIVMTDIQLPKSSGGLIGRYDADYPFTAKLTNTGLQQETINVEAGFYTQDYAKNVACMPGFLASIVGGTPVANCVNEPFVKTISATLAPGETKNIEIDVSPLNAYITLAQGNAYILSQTPLVSFIGAYKTCAQPITPKPGQTICSAGKVEGTGGYVGGSSYDPNVLTDASGLGSSPITCGGMVYGTIKLGIFSEATITVTADYHTCIDKVFHNESGTIDVNATIDWKGKTLSDLQKLSLTTDEISSVPNEQLFSSSCLTSPECLPRENYSVSCVKLSTLENDGTLTKPQGDSFFSTAGKIINGATTGAGVGGALGVAICGTAIVGAIITAAGTAGVAAAGTLPAAIAICGASVTTGVTTGALAGGAIAGVIKSGDPLVKALQASDANSVGICTAVPAGAGSISGFISKLAFFKITGNSTTDGYIIGGALLFLVVLLFMRSSK